MRRYRLLGLSVLGAVVVLAGVLFFGNLNSNLVYYLTPNEAVSQRAAFVDGRRFQLGGLVREGSVVQTKDGLQFVVAASTSPAAPVVAVDYRGAPAQLFRAGVGVVLQGAWRGDRFVADTMMVKHDQNYRAPTQTAGRAPVRAK